MDGVHDLGGMHGFGPVIREAGEPVFHAPWEATVVALMRSARANGVFNIDEFRHAIERMPPARYLSATYYERWLEAVATLAIEKGLTTADELEQRSERPESSRDTRRRTPTTEPAAVQSAPGAPDAVVSPTSSFRPETSAPRFNAGDAIVTIRARPKGHTRLPRYARGKRGRVHAYRGFQVFPDASAHGRGENPQPLYSVRFEGDELWGDSGEPSQAVYLDLWESYLLPAGEGGR